MPISRHQFEGRSNNNHSWSEMSLKKALDKIASRFKGRDIDPFKDINTTPSYFQRPFIPPIEFPHGAIISEKHIMDLIDEAAQCLKEAEEAKLARDKQKYEANINLHKKLTHVIIPALRRRKARQDEIDKPASAKQNGLGKRGSINGAIKRMAKRDFIRNRIPAGNYEISTIQEKGEDDFEIAIYYAGEMISPREDLKHYNLPWLNLFTYDDVCFASEAQIMKIKEDLERIF